MVNPWIEHIKRYAKETGKSYGCALSDPECKASYKQKPPTSSESTGSAGASEYINKVRFYKTVINKKERTPKPEKAPKQQKAPKQPKVFKPRAELPREKPITFKRAKSKTKAFLEKSMQAN